MSRISGLAVGTLSPYTEFGPPLRMIPVGRHSRTHSSDRVGGWISEYTRASRTRRAMSCVNCDPKSRIRMRLDTSTPPRGISQTNLLDLHRLQIENRGARRAKQPAAGLTRVHDQRLTMPPDLG